MANLIKLIGHSLSVLCIDTKLDGSLIISGGEEGEVCLWQRDGTLVHKLNSEVRDCTSVSISQSCDEKFFAAFGKSVKEYDRRNITTAVDTYQFNDAEINQLVLDQKENYLAACDDSGKTRIISLQDKQLYKTLEQKHTNICSTVCFRINKPWEIITGGMDCNVIHWDFSRPKCINQFNIQEQLGTYAHTYMVNPPFVHHMSMSPDGKFLACALGNGYISIFDTSRKNISEVFSLHAHSLGVTQVNFITDTKLVSGGNDSILASWDLSKIENNEVGLASNGHSDQIQNRNDHLSEICRVGYIQCISKVNWMKFFMDGNTCFAILADQTSDLTVLPYHLY